MKHCFKCKKIIWYWQDWFKSLDWYYHSKCHPKFGKEIPK